MSPSTTSRVTTDHDEIRHWAEERGARPAAVARAGSRKDSVILRLEFPGAPDPKEQAPEEISWEEWFDRFDKRGLALLYQEETAGGDKSNFNEIISSDTAEQVSSSVGGKGRSATPKPSSKSVQSESRIRAGETPASRPRGRRSVIAETREPTLRKSTSARGRSSTSGRASTESRTRAKRSANSRASSATRSGSTRESRTTFRSTSGTRQSARSSGSNSRSRKSVSNSTGKTTRRK